MSATPFSENLRRWNRECSGYEPSMSLLQRGADDAADLIDELCDALEMLLERGFMLGAEPARAALNKARGEQ